MENQLQVINPYAEGPYVQVAAFCENVVEGKDGVLSLIRLIDTITHTVQNPNPPLDMPSISWNMKLVLMLKAGTAIGRHEVKIIPRLPNGETKTPLIMSIHLTGEERGANIVADINFTFEYEGLYWFDIYFNDRPLTKIPFRTKYERFVVSSP